MTDSLSTTSATTALASVSASGSASASTSGASGTPAERLHKAAQQFEAIFVRQMLSAARATNFDSNDEAKDPGHDTFAQMRDDRLADIASQTGTIGIAKQIESALAPLVGASGATAAAKYSTTAGKG